MEIATIKEVQNLFPKISKSTASNYIRYVRDVLNKPRPKIITIDEFKQVHGLIDTRSQPSLD
jgi:protoheme ferro-lyase